MRTRESTAVHTHTERPQEDPSCPGLDLRHWPPGRGDSEHLLYKPLDPGDLLCLPPLTFPTLPFLTRPLI